jgi:hypothetical protein
MTVRMVKKRAKSAAALTSGTYKGARARPGQHTSAGGMGERQGTHVAGDRPLIVGVGRVGRELVVGGGLAGRCGGGSVVGFVGHGRERKVW